MGNDQILCGNVASTYYVLAPMKDATHVCYAHFGSRIVLTTLSGHEINTVMHGAGYVLG